MFSLRVYIMAILRHDTGELWFLLLQFERQGNSASFLLGQDSKARKREEVGKQKSWWRPKLQNHCK